MGGGQRRTAALRLLAVALLVGAVTVPVALPAVTAQQRANTALVSLADRSTTAAATADAEQPDVSADGRVVAFQSTAANLDPDGPPGRGDRTNVYVRDLDTGTTELVSLDEDGGLFPGGASQASVSGDGSRVAFTGDATSRDAEITGDLEVDRVVFVVEEAGQDGGGLFLTSVDGAPPRKIPGTTGGDASPTVSPDGRRVAFVRGGDLWAVDLDGGEPEQLTDTEDVVESDPAWSPDGVRLLYAFDDSDPQPDMPSTGLRVHDVTTGEASTLSIPGGSPDAVEDPVWSPDGLRIAVELDDPVADPRVFTADLDPEDGLGTLLPIGIGPPGLTVEHSPTWSPDGQWLAFVREFDEGDPEVHVVVPGPQSLSSPLFAGAGPVPADLAWSADGDWILVDGRDGDTGQLHRIGVADGEVSEPLAPLDVPAPPAAASLEPAVAPTQLGADTPLAVSAAVRSSDPGGAVPTGPVSFRLCGPFEGPSACFGGATIASPRTLTADPVEPEQATATLSMAEQVPPAGLGDAFGSVGSWCFEAAYLGGGIHRPAVDRDEGRLCHDVTKDQPDVAVDVQAFQSGEAFLDVGVQVGDPLSETTPTGVVTLWYCGPDEATAAGCPEGGARVAGPQALTGGEGGASASFSVGLGDDPDNGPHCVRVEYGGDGDRQAVRTSGPDRCATFDDRPSIDVVSDPGGVDFDAPVLPGTEVTVFATQGGFENIPVDFFLCGPADVTRDGCESGGEEVEVGVGWNQGSGTETDRVTIEAPADEGVHCWRVDQPALGRDVTNTTSACFAVSAGYDGAAGPGGTRVYVRDREAGTTTLVSVDEDGAAPDFGDSSQPSISDDGTRVAFTATSPLVEPVGEGQSLFGPHVFVRDLDAGTTTWVSVTECFGSDCSFEGKHSPALSGDGSAVAFLTSSSQVEAFLPDGRPWSGAFSEQVLVRDLVAGRTTVESLNEDGQPANAEIRSPSLSTDGSRLAFAAEPVSSEGPSLAILAMAVSQPGVWLRDRDAGTDELVSVSADGGPLQGPPLSGGAAPAFVRAPAISGDGRTVVFESNAVNLVADDPCSGSDDPFCAPWSSVYARDVEAGQTRRESVRSDGTLPTAGSASEEPAVDADGGVVAFSSDAPDLVDDVELPAEIYQVYARLRPSGLTIDPDPLTFGDARVDGDPVVRTATVRTVGGRPVTVSGVTVSGVDAADFSASGCVGTTLAAGETCAVEVTFAPRAIGARTGVLVVAVDSAGVTASADLRGTGVTGAIEVDPTSVTFGARPVGTTSGPRAVSVTNAGTAAVAVTAVTLAGADPGSFLLADGCAGVTLAPDADCTVRVRHRPTTSAPQDAQMLIGHDAADDPEVVRLRGRGDPSGPGEGALTVTPDPVDFGVVPLDTPSPQRVVTVTNTGDADVVVDGFRLTGPGRDRFTVVPGNDTCTGATLQPGRGCGISLVLDTSRPGAPRPVLRVDSDADEPADAVVLRANVPLLEITPSLGPTGFVPEVTGRFFPPNTDLRLTWRTGLGVSEVRTDADGALTARVLVFRRDVVGPRLIVASLAEEAWATAEFLVVRSSVQPGDFSSRRG